MKGTLRIVGAGALGVLLILGALRVSAEKKAEADAAFAEVIVAPVDERPYVATKDSDGDGLQDWEEELGVIAIRPAGGSTSAGATEGAGDYTPPTTLTGKFGVAFLKDYLQGKMEGQDFSTDGGALVGSAVEAINANAQSKAHTGDELTLVPTTEESVREYGNTLAGIIILNATNTENEALILKKALDTKNEDMLKGLTPIRESYEHIRDALIAMPVPEDISYDHLTLLNRYEAILTDVRAMEIAFDDPLYALARIGTYQRDTLNLYTALKGMNTIFLAHNVSYTDDELGVFFSMLDI